MDSSAENEPRAENKPRARTSQVDSQRYVMSADVARGHGGDGGGDDRPPPYQIPTDCGGCLGNRGKSTQKPNFGGRRASRLHTRQETRNLGLKAITDKSGPVPIRFEYGDRETLMPLGDHAAHWANYLMELVRELPLHYPSWRQMLPERKARVVTKIGTQFDLQPYMQSELWPEIRKGIDQHLSKIYTDNKSLLKKDYWVKNPDDESYDEEMQRLQALGKYTDDQIMVMVRKGKQRGHIPGVGQVLAGRSKDVLDVPVPRCNHTSDVDELKRNNKQLKKEMDMIMKVVRSDDKMSQLLTQLQSQHDIGSGNGSGAGGDDESGDDEDADEDEDS
ncbi:hypothetical protein Tco_1153772 [Tanacetum coccineum]